MTLLLFKFLTAYLSHIHLTSYMKMRTQHFLWLFLIPLFQILPGNDIFLVSSQCHDDQKSLLLQLKDSLQYDSTLSNKLARWNHMTSECCNWDGVACDLSGHVIALELDNDTISSGIENSSALFSLQYLQKLNLAYNNFNVGIPVGISNLTNLKYLNLSNAGFVGQIPMMLSRLTRLVTLDLSTLLPDFDQPLKLENPNLTKFIENSTELRELYLDGVDLSAQRTEWCQSLSSYLPNLKVLSLRTCQISGPIDESIGKLQMLESLDLSRNHLSGEIPSELKIPLKETEAYVGSLSTTVVKAMAQSPCRHQLRKQTQILNGSSFLRLLET